MFLKKVIYLEKVKEKDLFSKFYLGKSVFERYAVMRTYRLEYFTKRI